MHDLAHDLGSREQRPQIDRVAIAQGIAMFIEKSVGGGLSIAIIAPWGRANPECSIFCVIANKLKDPVDWNTFEADAVTRDMALAVQAEMRRNGISYSMPNYKQHKVNLNNEQYNGMLNAINAPMKERKDPKSGNPMNIIQDLYSAIKSEKSRGSSAGRPKLTLTVT